MIKYANESADLSQLVSTTTPIFLSRAEIRFNFVAGENCNVGENIFIPRILFFFLSLWDVSQKSCVAESIKGRKN